MAHGDSPLVDERLGAWFNRPELPGEGCNGMELGMRLYPNSRKESETAFGPGRQAALAILPPTNAKAKFKSCSLEGVTALS